MTKKHIIFWGTFLALAAPFIYNIGLYARTHGGLLAESSVYSLDRHKYFADFLRGGSVFFAGQHSVFIANYFVFYALWSSLNTISSDITSYFLLLIGFAALGFRYLVRLLVVLGGDEDVAQTTTRRWAAACALALLYFSSLSIFNYLKSNALFALPYMVLPPFLYWALDFVKTGDKRRLILLLLFSLVLTDFNLTHTFIIVAFINIFLLITRHQTTTRGKTFLVRWGWVNAVLAPACCFLLVLVYENALYSGTLSKFAADIVENMYSDNANYLNIFLQLTDWGIFGSWRGVPYYVFSAFYSRPQIWAFGLLPYLLLAFSLVSTSAGNAQKRLAASFLLVCVVIFQLMLGNNNVLYRFLYDHVVIFQVFRNVTKLAPALYLTVLFVIYIRVRDRLAQRRYFWVVMTLVLAAFVYNIPYWSYGGALFSGRTIDHIPTYWKGVATYFADSTSPDSRILALPATYINDIYHWGDRTAAVQGNLLDVLIRNHSYRLSECCIGTLRFQRDARNVFIPSTRSTRRLGVNYSRLSGLVRKYHLDYVLVSADLVSEYQDLNDIYRWLKEAGYVPQASFGPVSIYRNATNFALPLAGRNIRFQQINPLRYRVFVSHLKGRQDIVLSKMYNRRWAAFVDSNPTDGWCIPMFAGSHNAVQCRPGGEKPWDEMIRAFSRSPLSSVHVVSASGENQWVLTAKYIKEHFPARDYYVNPDGSINFELELYFEPQGAFLLGCFVCAVAFLSILAILLPALTKRSRDRMSYAVAGAMAITAFAIIMIVTESSGSPIARASEDASKGRPVAIIVPAGASVTFHDPDQAAQRLEFSAAQRGGRKRSGSRWSVEGCAKIARFSWAEDSAGGLQLKIAPVAIGNCMLDIAAVTAGGIRTTESVPVTVSGPLAWVSNGKQVRHLSIVLPGGSAQVQRLTLGKVNDSRGLWPELTNAECNGIVRISPQIGSPLQDVPSQSVATVVITPRSPGICTASFRDRYSPASAGAATVTIQITALLSFLPNRDSNTITLRFAGVTSAPQRTNIYQRPGSAPVKLVFGSNGCAAVAGFHTLPAFAPAKLAQAPPLRPSATVIVSPVAAGRCAAILVDPLDASVTVNVVVGGSLNR